jgi:hypothetical protein
MDSFYAIENDLKAPDQAATHSSPHNGYLLA